MKTNSSVGGYVAKAQPFARPILKHLRRLVHKACPGTEESIKWGFPFFLNNGILCFMTAFKAHCGFGFSHRGIRAQVKRLAGTHANGHGHFGRITSLEDLPNDAVLLRLLKKAAELNASGIPNPRRPARKPLPTPRFLADVLRRNKRASTAFEKLSPSHRREYIEWITEAKRDETRSRRLATTLKRLTAGKSLNSDN